MISSTLLIPKYLNNTNSFSDIQICLKTLDIKCLQDLNRFSSIKMLSNTL